MLLQPPISPEPLLTWDKPIRELIGFLASFCTLGALGFRYAVLAPLLRRAEPATPLAATLTHAASRAAGIGAVGSVLGACALTAGVIHTATARHLDIMAVVHRGGGMMLFQMAALAVMLISFGLAWRRRPGAWAVAAIATVALALREVVALKWTALVNPLHVVAGSLWIGTLFVVVVAGLSVALGAAMPREQRGRVVVELIGGFSPLALAAAGLLAITGVTTAVRHLKYLSALWTTPYGYTFIAKLCVVAMVVVLGAWNWKRVRPRLGDESVATEMHRSAIREIVVAGVVLLITAVLVSLPSPRLPSTERPIAPGSIGAPR
ncbi:MAG: CopD family protein [Gemmatimonadota bacterium]|nr:CopD family protein [Gemmatimonadota bacterium]